MPPPQRITATGRTGPRTPPPPERPLPANIIEALSDDRYFAGMMDGETWAPWRAFLKGLFAIPMGEADLALWTEFTGRTIPPDRPFRNATTIVGRRGGKSRTLGIIGAYMAALIDHAPHLVPGETPVIGVLAQDRRQARIIMQYVKGTIEAAPALGPDFIVDSAVESLTLKNGVAIEVGTSSVAAPRGRTYICLMADETAFWPVDGSANPDIEVINAARHGLTTIPYSILLKASSPYAKRGVLYSDYTRYYGRDDAPVLVWKGGTEQMNASLIGDPLIAEVRLEDPERASGEFDAEFRSDISAFIERGAVEAVIMHGHVETPPDSMMTYVAFTDPSGGSADSFTLAIGHIDHDGTAVLDALRERKPPFSPDAVVQEFSELMAQYRVSRVIGDAYAGQWPRERFSTYGVTYETSSKTKNEIYLAFAPALNGRRIRLLDSPRLVGQFCGLDRRTVRGGRDSIDHAPGGHDDVANAAAGALVQILEDRRPALIKRGDLLTDDERPVEPRNIYGILALLWITMDGICAWAISGCAGQFDAPTQVLLDYAVKPWSFEVLGEIATRMDEEAEAALEGNHDAKTRGMGIGCCLLVPAQLQGAANLALAKAFSGHDARQPWYRDRRVGADALEDSWFDDLTGTMLTATAAVGEGRVKLAAVAVEKAAGTPLLGALAIKPGEDIAANPLRIALMVLFAQLGEAPARPNPNFGTARIEFH
jgi:hypothetical protein